MYKQIFFTNVRRILDEQGITKRELCNLADISDSFANDITKGSANPSLKVMESIADAIDTPLPLLLELTDLDKEALDELAGGKAKNSLPGGYVRISAILTEYQAFMVRQWEQVNKKSITVYQKKVLRFIKPKKIDNRISRANNKLSNTKLAILDVIRETGQAMSSREIAEALLQRKGEEATAQAIRELQSIINTNVRRLISLGFIAISMNKRKIRSKRKATRWEIVER